MAETKGAGGRVGRGSGLGRTFTAVALVLPLLGGVAGAQSDPERGYAIQPFTPRSFAMPTGEGCAGDVARWQAVQDNDYASGNIGLKAYHQIKDEIARAGAACQAGQDGAARAMIHASKRRHGYPD